MSLIEDHFLLQPLITTTSSGENEEDTGFGQSDDSHSFKSISIRFLSIFVVAIISLWANYEASKGFEINIISENHQASTASRRFNLLYVSNDKISRVVLNTSEFVENILYPPNESHVKRTITRVTVRLADQNLTNPVIVNHQKRGEFELNISPSLLLLEEKRNVEKEVVMAVQRGMARVWIWSYGDYHGVPESLIQGIKSGFIRRLNQGIRDRWDEKQTLDDALLGISSMKLCADYHSLEGMVVAG
ncbi:hypothetical protein C5167_025835 [Papaver somniferum]|uniref:Uncharacterized protein n=1 Tax=Papaver somniferum TaxID=3469 RepID=A0A4Y7JSM0_PAPSO|nr:uncharacterized protein LOC113284551 [Papaver somniferum]RZC64093.1 hypothetical protein C5167_025835 [Papaver somniferum]